MNLHHEGIHFWSLPVTFERNVDLRTSHLIVFFCLSLSFPLTSSFCVQVMHSPSPTYKYTTLGRAAGGLRRARHSGFTGYGAGVR